MSGCIQKYRIRAFSFRRILSLFIFLSILIPVYAQAIDLRNSSWFAKTGSYHGWTLHFINDKEVRLIESIGPEARMPLTMQGSYQIKNKKVILNFPGKIPFPSTLTLHKTEMINGKWKFVRSKT